MELRFYCWKKFGIMLVFFIRDDFIYFFYCEENLIFNIFFYGFFIDL